MTPPLFSIALLLAGCIGLLFLVGLPGLSILLACTSCVAVAGWDVLVRSRRPSPAALRESADRLRAIIEAEPECVKTVARDGGLLQMNPAGLRLIQADDFQSVYLANIFDLIHPDSRDAYRELHEAVLRGESRSLQFKLIGLKGAHRWMETTAVPFRGDDGEFIHLAITRDISEWKRREEELAAAWEAAEAAARAKGTFLANMSHEIRTPLTAILGYTEIARSDPGSARAKHAIDVIKFSGEHLNALLSDVLDLSKIEFGELAIEEIPTSISETLRDVHLLHAQSAADKGLTFEVIEEETLPPVVITDPVRLRQILINLVSNAVKFTERGHICVRARSEPCTGDQARLVITIEDTGIGMDDAAMQRVFEPFQQADASMTRRFGGTGLGLAISARLAERLGGTLQGRSEPGCGATFTIDITLALAAPSTEAPAETSPPSLCGMRVLLAEDNIINAKLVEFHLAALGATVLHVERGDLALDCATSQGSGFDVVLMDMQMPVMDGYEATRQIRQRGISTPIIALTAHALADDRRHCIEAGCDDYLSKPISRQDLALACARWLCRTA